MIQRVSPGDEAYTATFNSRVVFSFVVHQSSDSGFTSE